MNEDTTEYLKQSIENINNKSILNLTTKIIKERKEEIINELPIYKNKKNEIKKKLKEYRYIDEINELHIGAFIRWIKFQSNNEITITNGALLTDVLFEDNIQILLKNNTNRFFRVDFNNNLIFQKLTDQEKIILFAIDNIDNLKV